MTELEPRAGESLERMLDRYTRVRLEPSPAQVKRARAAVMEAAWRRHFEGPAATDDRDVTAAMRPAGLGTAQPAAAGPRRGLFAAWGPRRIGTSLAAAVIAGLLVGSTAFAASRAGAPLYEVRVALEELTLPADAQARLQAEIAQAQGRLAEIVEAVAKDDPGAVAAAVRAYESSLDDLDEASGGPAARALVAVQYHRQVLLDVLSRAPENAVAGLQNAIDRSAIVIARLGASAPTTGDPAGTGGGSNGSGSGGNGSGSGAGTGGSGNGGGAGGGSGSSGTGGNGNPNAGPGNNNGQGQGTNNGNGNGNGANATPKPARTPQPTKTKPPAEDPTKEARTTEPGGNRDDQH